MLALERVQRRFTGIVQGIIGLLFDERFTILGLYSLEFKRMGWDLIKLTE